MSFTSDTRATTDRFARLHDYMDRYVLAPGGRFICGSCRDCSASVLMNRANGQLRTDRVFTPGQLSHVGTHYDLSEDDRSLRILVIPMDTGGAGPESAKVTLETRRTGVAEKTAERAYLGRNSHMRGTTNALRLAIGRAPGDDAEGEWLTLNNEPKPVHLFHCFAMANLRLCSATEPGSNQSKATRTMSKNCLRHLAKTIEILEPTLCIVQGTSVANHLGPIIEQRTRITENLAWVRMVGVKTLLATFVHPSYRQRPRHWGHIRSVPYLWNTVQPTIQRARQELGFVDSERSNRFEADREKDLAIVDEMREALEDVADEDLEREMPRAIAQVRAKRQPKPKSSPTREMENAPSEIPKDYVAMSDWWREGLRQGFTNYALSKAVGGDRVANPVLDERFRCVYVQVGNRLRKYLSPQARTDDAYDAIRATQKSRDR